MNADELRRVLDEAGLTGLPGVAARLGMSVHALRKQIERGQIELPDPVWVVNARGPYWSDAQIDEMEAAGVGAARPIGRPKKVVDAELANDGKRPADPVAADDDKG